MWFDLHTGVFHILLAPSTALNEAQQVASAHGVTGHVAFDSVAHTWAQVEAETTRLRVTVNAAAGSAPVTVEPSVQQNAPVVELETTASAEEALSVAKASSTTVKRVPHGALKMAASIS